MVMIMSGTFFRTRTTNLDTGFREYRYVRAVSSNRLTEQTTYIGTIPIESDTARHMRDVFFIQTGIEARVAGNDASIQFC